MGRGGDHKENEQIDEGQARWILELPSRLKIQSTTIFASEKSKTRTPRSTNEADFVLIFSHTFIKVWLMFQNEHLFDASWLMQASD